MEINKILCFQVRSSSCCSSQEAWRRDDGGQVRTLYMHCHWKFKTLILSACRKIRLEKYWEENWRHKCLKVLSAINDFTIQNCNSNYVIYDQFFYNDAKNILILSNGWTDRFRIWVKEITIFLTNIILLFGTNISKIVFYHFSVTPMEHNNEPFVALLVECEGNLNIYTFSRQTNS